MGFSLGFYPIAGDELVEADRAGLRAFFTDRGLAVSSGPKGIVHCDNGDALAFDGHWTDLILDPLDQAEPVTGSLSHATLTEEECTFVFELCRAGRLMIVNHQGEPMYLGITGVHSAESFPTSAEPAWVDSPSALAAALGGSFGEFRSYLTKVLDGTPGDQCADTHRSPDMTRRPSTG